MLASADTALNLSILKRRLLHLHRILFLCLIRLPVDLWLENNVLSNARGVCLWAGWLSLFLAEL